MEVIESGIQCQEHKGVRYIDTEMNDVRTVCDRCGRIELQSFSPMAAILSVEGDTCRMHGSGMQTDMLGLFCVYCIMERASDILEGTGYEIA